MDFIEISDDDEPRPTFDKEKWIGSGIIYPTSNTPRELIHYVNSFLEIPPYERKTLLPDLFLPLSKLVSENLPDCEEGLVHLSATSAFQSSAANIESAWMKKRTVPTRTFVEKAVQALGQAVLDGALSIRDPRSEGARLPIWSISYWQLLCKAHDVLREYDRARAWLLNGLRVADEGGREGIKDALALLDALPWGVDTMIAGANITPVMALAVLLSDGKVNSTTVNMMVHWLKDRVGMDEVASTRYEVAGFELWHAIANAKSSSAFSDPTQRSKYLQRLCKELGDSDKVLLFPVYLDTTQHFVAVQADLGSRTFSYGKIYH